MADLSNHQNMNLPVDLKDIYVGCNERSLMRSFVVEEHGSFRLARRDAQLYSVLIFSIGAWNSCRILTGTGRPIFSMPVIVDGSFYLQAGAEEGLILSIYGTIPPRMTIVWCEEDSQII